jgi:hypothetical protein
MMMEQQPALMQRAQQRAAEPAAEEFQRPDTASLVPKGAEDAYARIVAAGQKLMYSQDMRDDLQKEVARDVPVAQKMAEGVVGLMLTMDKQAKGGLPMEALFPAALELLNEAAAILTESGQTVTMEDWKDGARMMFVIMARKFGAKDEEIMAAVQQMVPGGSEMEPGEGQPHEQAEPPSMEQQETQAEAQGMPEPDEQQRGM